jgi:hypothetical protein
MYSLLCNRLEEIRVTAACKMHKPRRKLVEILPHQHQRQFLPEIWNEKVRVGSSKKCTRLSVLNAT